MKPRPRGWYRQPEFEGVGHERVWVRGDGELALCRVRLDAGVRWWQLRRFREGKGWWPLVSEGRTIQKLIAAWVTDILLQ